MSEPAPTRFGLLRHAETEWNKEKRIQGQSDSPLTAAGIAMAEKWGKTLQSLSIDRIMTSDLKRARCTAHIINRFLSVPVTEETGLREQQWGQWEGLPVTHVENEKRFKDQLSSGWGFRPPGGENRKEVLERSRDTLIRAARTWPGLTIMVVTHEGVHRTLINGLCHRKYLPGESKLLKSRYLHWLIYREGTLGIEEINAVAL